MCDICDQPFSNWTVRQKKCKRNKRQKLKTNFWFWLKINLKAIERIDQHVECTDFDKAYEQFQDNHDDYFVSDDDADDDEADDNISIEEISAEVLSKENAELRKLIDDLLSEKETILEVNKKYRNQIKDANTGMRRFKDLLDENYETESTKLKDDFQLSKVKLFRKLSKKELEIRNLTKSVNIVFFKFSIFNFSINLLLYNISFKKRVSKKT
jgi:hypothetical protein